MSLTLPTPLEIPAVAAKSYPGLWLLNVICHAPAMQSGSIRIETLPCNLATGEIASGEHMTAIQTDRLWQAVNAVPEVAAAMGAIFAAVDPLRAWVAAQEALANAPE